MSLSALDASFARAERDYLTPREEPECVCDTRDCRATHPDEDTARDCGWTVVHNDDADLVLCPECVARMNAEARSQLPGEMEDVIPFGADGADDAPGVAVCASCGGCEVRTDGLCSRCVIERDNALDALALGQVRAGYQHSALRREVAQGACRWVARLESFAGEHGRTALESGDGSVWRAVENVLAMARVSSARGEAGLS